MLGNWWIQIWSGRASVYMHKADITYAITDPRQERIQAQSSWFSSDTVSAMSRDATGIKSKS